LRKKPPTKRPVRLVLTMGDPAGIGPELCVKLLTRGPLPPDVALTVVGSASVLREAGRVLGRELSTPIADSPAQQAGKKAVLDLHDFPLALLRKRRPKPECGRASMDYIERVVSEVQEGRADAIVTSPISKQAIAAAGSPYPGHTEMLAALTGGGRSVMVLMCGKLRVAFATTHVALRDVSARLTSVAISHTGKVLADGLERYFAVKRPRIAVCALNPHASDGGRFGDEEERVIAPAIKELVAEGVSATGPYSCDTLFVEAMSGHYDGVVAMYHDQGMIPIKVHGIAGVVNVTFGLPIIRTSPGHGTAYDIAGTGVADVSSTAEAVVTAAAMVRASWQL